MNTASKAPANTLHWQLSGPADAPVVVLLNSIGADRRMWRGQLGPLTERFRVVQLDSHGSSAPVPAGRPCELADLAAEVLTVLDELDEQLGVHRVQLAGVSLGGMIAMWLAARQPDRVGRLAVLCSAAQLPPARSWLERAATVRAEGTSAIADATVGRWITAGLAERDPELVGWLRAMVGAVDDESYARCCEAIASMDLRPELARISAPTMVIAGEQDRATPPEHAGLIAAGIAGAELRMLSPAAHLATVEATGQISQLLLAHFQPVASSDRPDSLAEGERTRRAVLGDSYVERALGQASEFSLPFQEFITRYAWGEIWSRPGLGRRERSIATLAVLVTLGADYEIELHLRAALGNGLRPEEILELLLQVAIYAGVPRANRAFAIAAKVIDSS